MTRTRYRVFEREYPYFLTGTVVAWLPVSAYPRFVEIIFDSWRFLQENRDIRIYGYVILENHLHWIASGGQLPEQVGRFKSYTARKIIDDLQTGGFQTLVQELRYFKLHHKVDQEHQLWQEGSHPRANPERGNDATEARLHPQQPRAARLRGRPGALAVFERSGLCRDGGADGRGD